MQIHHFFHVASSTLSYIVHDGSQCVVIDPVRDYEHASGKLAWDFCDKLAQFVGEKGLNVAYALDTHAHADHLSGLPYFKQRFGAKTVTGGQIGKVQESFKAIFNLPGDFPVDGSQFDLLVDDGECFSAGELEIRPMHTPGHTPSHMSWLIGDALFVGDTLFAPDYGSARCDFPGGSAEALWESVQKIYALPDETRLFLCHDYRPGGRELIFQSTVGAQKANNQQIDAQTTLEEYVQFRSEKDAGLSAPGLILPSLQVNIRAGELPEPESNGRSYLKIPLELTGKTN